MLNLVKNRNFASDAALRPVNTATFLTKYVSGRKWLNLVVVYKNGEDFARRIHRQLSEMRQEVAEIRLQAVSISRITPHLAKYTSAAFLIISEGVEAWSGFFYCA